MAEGGSDEIVEKIVCGLCSEEYKQPKLLPCFHSYCLECLEKFVVKNARDNAFDCPLCDTTIEVPEGGVNAFEWNIYLDSKLKSESKESHDCDLCGPGVNATNHCIDCEENYCERCSEMHMKQRMSRTHTLMRVSDSEAGGTGTKTITKKAFCTKHTKEEMKVVCKDCNIMLCVVCKLTDHEKHNSVDIEDEASNVKKKIKEAIQKAENRVTKLDNILDTLNEAKDLNNRNRDGALEKLREHGDKLKEQIDKKINDLEQMINGQFADAFSKIASFNTGTEKIKTSLTNLSMHANHVVALSDIVPLLTTVRKLDKQIAQCISKAERHEVAKQDVVYSTWGKDVEFVINNLGLTLGNPSVKRVSKLGECRFGKDGISNNICSLSTTLDNCTVSFTDTNSICAVRTPGSYCESQINFQRGARFLLCATDDQVFLSHIAKKKLKVWKRSSKAIVDLKEYTMYPHGCAHRFNNGNEELVVCFLTDNYDLMSTSQSKGTVKVLPLDDEKKIYDFISERTPAPTRVAVCKVEEFVCLAYPSVGKISVHAKDGLTIHCFDAKSLGLDQRLFRPFGVCFDNENCIIITDRDGGQVLRVSLLGHVIQTLVKGNRPTAIDVDRDDKLWVGYEDKDVTVFQMTYKSHHEKTNNVVFEKV